VIDLRNLRLGAAGSGTSLRAMNATAAADRLRIADGSGIELLEAGEIDAWIVDEFDAVAAARASDGRLRALPEPLMAESYAFVLAAGREDLKYRLDLSLDALERDGRLARIAREFGVERDAGWPIEW
jgi:ABC-type amino acid transport substrate-binding protein